MQFGQRVRQIRCARQLTQRELAEQLGVSISYISKVENETLHFGDYPSAKFIHKLSAQLEADEDELLLLADKVPDDLRRRIREHPEVFRLIATLDDGSLDSLTKELSGKERTHRRRTTS